MISKKGNKVKCLICHKAIHSNKVCVECWFRLGTPTDDISFKTALARYWNERGEEKKKNDAAAE